MPNPMITEVLASWVTPWSEEVWATLASLSSGEPSAEPRWQLFLGPVLPDETEPRIASLVVVRPRDESSKDDRPPRIVWTLDIRPAPKGDPPDNIVKASAKLGGRAKFAQTLADPATNPGPPIGVFRIRLRIEESAYRCNVLPVVLDEAIAPAEPATHLGRAVTREQIGYRLTTGLTDLMNLHLFTPIGMQRSKHTSEPEDLFGWTHQLGFLTPTMQLN